MNLRVILVGMAIALSLSCSGTAKHFPSSNPPEYDPNKDYSKSAGLSQEPRAAGQAPPVRPAPLQTPAPSIAGSHPVRSLPSVATSRPAELARRILAGGPDGKNALVEAVTEAGFGVLDSRKRLVIRAPNKPELGMPLDEWEATVLARSAAERMTVPYAEFESDVLLAVGDEQDGRLLLKMLLADIRAGVTDASPTVRMWTGLIVELGRQSASPYDLVTLTYLGTVYLDGLQQVLMLKHLSASIFALGIQHATAHRMGRRDGPSWSEPGHARLVADHGRLGRRVTSLQSGDPCGFGTDEGTETSEAASLWGAGLKFVFGPLRQATEELPLLDLYRKVAETVDQRTTQSFVERMKALREIEFSKTQTADLNRVVNTLSRIHTVATALLSLAELTAVMNAVTIDISLEPTPPLVRTKTRQPGDYAKVAAALSFDVGRLDLPKQLDVHCAGMMLAGLGLDFSMPQNGPIKGADVEWTLVEGGLRLEASTGKVTEAIVELENSGPRIQDAGVGFGDVKKSVRTDEQGRATAGIHGAPQKRDLGRDPQPVMKQATVRANVQLKPADMFRDLADALKGPWALPAQVLYRSHLMGKNYSFQVKDWTQRLVLEFHSHIVQAPLNLDVPGIGRQLSTNGFDAHVRASVPIEQKDDHGWVGEGTMRYETRSTTQPAQCELRVQGTGATTFHVQGGSITSEPEPFAVNLVILPGTTGETAEAHCSSGQTPEKLKELFASQGVRGGEAHGAVKGGGWSAAFNVTRFTTFNKNKGGYEIGGWTPGRDSDVLAHKTIRMSCSLSPLQPCQEVTELTLKRVREEGERAQ